jgi:Skp family chaperone for outer membrane proteins
MAQLADAIRQVNARELDACEAALSQCIPPPPQMSPQQQHDVIVFVNWAETQKVRALPARPCSVAAFAQWQKDMGVPKDKITATLSAIEAMHNAASLGYPIATPIVRTITAASTIEAPRSWTKDEKQVFTQLPVEIQRVVARRERDREIQLRRGQNEIAEMRKRLQADAAPKSADETRKRIEDAEEERLDRETRAYTTDEVKLNRQPDKGYVKPVSILNRVNTAAHQDSGFSGKLPKGE